ERDGPLHFVDSSKAPTPASRYRLVSKSRAA
ncbi:unnamed protein product, partial [Rotaria magnacalcarata]